METNKEAASAVDLYGSCLYGLVGIVEFFSERSKRRKETSYSSHGALHDQGGKVPGRTE